MSSSDEEFQADRLYEDSDAQPEPDPVTDEEEFCEIEPPLEASTRPLHQGAAEPNFKAGPLSTTKQFQSRYLPQM